MTKKIVEITKDFTQNTLLHKDTIYVIIGEIRVNPFVKIEIEDKTEIFLKNGFFKNQSGTKYIKSKLIFETGSKLCANSVFLKACNDKNKPVKLASNGGLYFVGSNLLTEKDGINSNQNGPKSLFKANLIHTSYLGSGDIANLSEEQDIGIDDYDGISVLGVSKKEWNVKKIYCEYSGDDGFDVQNSQIVLDGLTVIMPEEDGLNLVSSTVEVKKNIKVIVTLTDKPDRDMFDFENDTNFCLLKLNKGCKVDLYGLFGDQLNLLSADMPQPFLNVYKFKGTLSCGESLIFTNDYLLDK